MNIDAQFESQTRTGDSTNALSFQTFTKADQEIFKNCQPQRSDAALQMEQSGLLPSFSLNMQGEESACSTDKVAGKAFKSQSEELSDKASGFKDLRELTNWPELMRLLEKMRNGEELPPIYTGPVKYRDGIGSEKPIEKNPGGQPENAGGEKGGRSFQEFYDKISPALKHLTDWHQLWELLEKQRNGEEIKPINWPKPPAFRDGEPAEVVIKPIPVNKGDEEPIDMIKPPANPKDDGNHGGESDEEPIDMIKPPANPKDDGNHGGAQDSDDVIGQPVKEKEPPGRGKERELTEAELARQRMKARLRQIAEGRFKGREHDEPGMER